MVDGCEWLESCIAKQTRLRVVLNAGLEIQMKDVDAESY
jgi:hypothetical protein